MLGQIQKINFSSLKRHKKYKKWDLKQHAFIVCKKQTR